MSEDKSSKIEPVYMQEDKTAKIYLSDILEMIEMVQISGRFSGLVALAVREKMLLDVPAHTANKIKDFVAEDENMSASKIGTKIIRPAVTIPPGEPETAGSGQGAVDSCGFDHGR